MMTQISFGFGQKNARIFMLLLAVALVLGTSACKSSKNLSAPTELTEEQDNAAAEEAAKASALLAKMKADLRDMLNDPAATTLSELEAKESLLANIKAMGEGDAELNDLIAQVEAKLARERASLEAKTEEKLAVEQQLERNFLRIAQAADVDAANRQIQETLSLFSKKDAPVFIIISKAGGEPDYDRPTNIVNYLNYLKDQKKSPNRVDKVIYDEQGRIKELELIKE